MVDENEVLGKNFPTNEPSGTGSPFFEVHRRKKYTSGQKALTQDQVHKFLLHVTDLIHLGLFQLAIVSGIRREDIVRIKKSDMNLQMQCVTFYESKKRRTKTIYIPVTVANTLQMICNVNKKEVYLFPGNSEKVGGRGHLSGRNAYNLLQRYLREAGLESRPFHSLRATCVKLCQKRGWSVEQTAEHIGDTISVIQEHYAIPSSQEMRETVSAKPIL